MRISTPKRTRLFFGLLLFGLLAMTARNAVDPDLWWHLRTGQWIAETGRVPHTDPFSFTRAGSPWVSHEWLSEVVFYRIWRRMSWAGLIAFSAIVTAAGFMLLYLRCPGRRHWALGATTLGALASAPAWGVRPQMFTFLLASLFLWLIQRGEDRPRLLLWIPAVFLLWVNLHAGFALGPALLLAYCVGVAWEGVTGEMPWEQVRPHLARLLLVVLACLAVVPLNPSGVQLYRYPLDVLHSAGMRSFIVEWLSPDFHQFRYVPFLMMCLALIGTFGSTRSRPKARVLVPLLGTLFAALDAVRHIPIFALLAVPVIASAFADSRQRQLPPARPGRGSTRIQLLLPASAVILMAIFALVRWDTLVRSQARTEAEMFPKAAVEFLASHPHPAQLFVYYDWGGYAIWRLYPDYRVFVDGRADLYGDDLLQQFKTAVQLRSGWQGILEQWKVGTVLVPSSCALAHALALETGWLEEYHDSQAVVFRRKEQGSASVKNRQIPFPVGKKSDKIFTRALLNLRN
jgi:hypothetical protein